MNFNECQLSNFGWKMYTYNLYLHILINLYTYIHNKNKRIHITRLITGYLIVGICIVHNEKCWAGGSTSWNQDCQEKYQ